MNQVMSGSISTRFNWLHLIFGMEPEKPKQNIFLQNIKMNMDFEIPKVIDNSIFVVEVCHSPFSS